MPRHIRATEDKVRQAVFNILSGMLEGARVADVFAGSGALGLEALSRGAAEVAFLESDPQSLAAIRANLAQFAGTPSSGRTQVIPGDALRSLRRLAQSGETFDLLLVDPPYDRDWEKKVLNLLGGCAIVSPAGLVCLEHALKTQLPETAGVLTLVRQHRYGNTVLSLYKPG